jgi:hypothetical protein
MLIAQALGEYGGVAVLVEAFGSMYGAVDDFVRRAAGEWGMTGLGVAVCALFVWNIILRARR